CGRSREHVPVLKELIDRETLEFVTARVGTATPAEAFFRHCPDEQEAHRELTHAFDEAAPELAAMPGRGGATWSALIAPDDDGGPLRALVARALPDETITVCDGGEVAFVREQAHTRPADLPQLGPFARETFQQVQTSESGPALSRTDVSWNI